MGLLFISPFVFTASLPAGSSALPSNIAYFGSSQEEDDLDEEENEEEEEVRNGGGIHLHSGGSGSQALAASSCHSTPRKGKPPTRQPLNGHGKKGARFIPLLLMSLALSLSLFLFFANCHHFQLQRSFFVVFFFLRRRHQTSCFWQQQTWEGL